MGMCFEEFNQGQTFKSVGRTITETDVVGFAGLSGDFNPIHMDREFAAKGHFNKRIAHGMLVVSIVSGLIHQLNIIDDTTIALLEWQEIKFFRPVFIDDTVHVELEVLQKKETSKPDRGIIQLGVSIKNQHNEEVISAKMLILIQRKNSSI